MTTRTLEPRKPKPPKDPEIGDLEHDRLCNWLVENLTHCVEFLWGEDSEWLSEHVTHAVHRARESLGHEVEQLERIATHPGVPPRIANALKEKLVAGQQVRSEFTPPPLAKDVMCASVLQWEAQSELRAATGRSAGATKVVGFVDLLARVMAPESLELRTFRMNYGLDRFLPRSTKPEHGWIDDDPLGLADIRKFNFAKMEWSRKTGEFWVAFDVRVKLTTLGELLRELKTLAGFVGPETSIIVVTEKMPDAWRETLSHEEFGVLCPGHVDAFAPTRSAEVAAAIKDAAGSQANGRHR